MFYSHRVLPEVLHRKIMLMNILAMFHIRYHALHARRGSRVMGVTECAWRAPASATARVWGGRGCPRMHHVKADQGGAGASHGMPTKTFLNILTP